MLGACLLFGVGVLSATLLAATSPAPATAAPPAPAPAAASTAAERLQVYRDFRALFDAEKYSDAITPAEKLVTMTEAASGPNDPSLITPLVNLATTRYQASDYAGAEESYLRAIKIIEQASGGFSKSLIPPLRGLGLTYIAAGQPQAAVDQLRRGVDITRKIDGHFNVGQLELLDPLVRSYQQAGQLADAEREAIYGFRVSENKFGHDSIDLVPALEKLAHWYSGVNRNTTARQYYGRALGILQRAVGASDARMISPLRGIAATYRLEYVYGPELSAEQQAASTGATGLSTTMGTAPVMQEYNPANQKPDPAGETALRGALSIAEAASPSVEPALRADILLDLGDWLMLDAEKQAAMDTYRRALPLLKGLPPPDNAALDAPAQIMYRLPSAGYASQKAKPENIVEGYVDVEFTVTAEGRVTGEHTVGKSASDSQEKSVLSAVKRSRYRPRFEAGQPVETRGVRLHQQVYSVKSSGSSKS
jgi:tetratricopeptide (TPR) repeat protein